LCDRFDNQVPVKILFIAVNDLNDWIGCHPQALTPNIDHLPDSGKLTVVWRSL
jgi:hypothetical protein